MGAAAGINGTIIRTGSDVLVGSCQTWKQGGAISASIASSIPGLSGQWSLSPPSFNQGANVAHMPACVVVAGLRALRKGHRETRLLLAGPLVDAGANKGTVKLTLYISAAMQEVVRIHVEGVRTSASVAAWIHLIHQAPSLQSEAVLLLEVTAQAITGQIIRGGRIAQRIAQQCGLGAALHGMAQELRQLTGVMVDPAGLAGTVSDRLSCGDGRPVPLISLRARYLDGVASQLLSLISAHPTSRVAVMGCLAPALHLHCSHLSRSYEASTTLVETHQIAHGGLLIARHRGERDGC